GGAWGMALLAAYMVKGNGLSLADYLDEKVFKGNDGVEIKPTEEDVSCFDRYMESYKSSLGIFSNLKQ
ncbi:MAG: ATPase, partial [Bacteroidales bacterium]|nr:ATPase [Candidatus Cacconaster scatequi]